MAKKPNNLTIRVMLRFAPEHVKRLEVLMKAWGLKGPQAIRRAILDAATQVERQKV